MDRLNRVSRVGAGVLGLSVLGLAANAQSTPVVDPATYVTALSGFQGLIAPVFTAMAAPCLILLAIVTAPQVVRHLVKSFVH